MHRALSALAWDSDGFAMHGDKLDLWRGLPKESKTQSLLLVKQESHSSVNNIQEKMALEDGIWAKALCSGERSSLFPWRWSRHWGF